MLRLPHDSRSLVEIVVEGEKLGDENVNHFLKNFLLFLLRCIVRHWASYSALTI